MFTVVVNHFKSKGSLSPFGNNADQLDGQGNNNEARVQSAIALEAWLHTGPTRASDPDFLIVGDLNAHANEDPITFLEAAGYTDLAEAFIPGAYSFVCDGQVGALDSALASPSLLAQVTGATVWHVNADEPDAFDYNLEFGRDPALFSADTFRASDHDPILVGMELGLVVFTPEEILAFVQQALADGTLAGTGKQTAKMLINELEKAIRDLEKGERKDQAGKLVKAQEKACKRIEKIAPYTDGLEKPRDWVDGPATVKLNQFLNRYLQESCD